MRCVCKVFALLVVINVVLHESEAENSTRTLLQGTIKGFIQKSRNGRDYESYLGLPYALPPVGDLRFKSPQPPLKWQGVRNASSSGSSCPQHNLMNKSSEPIGDEDCLFVNVYVPVLEHPDNNLLPVMVWIHGGGFGAGSADPSFYGAGYLMDKDIILVTLNYRLGVLGFLSTEDDAAPGNWGLKDQVAALKWVNENIVQFGGDPNSVTIFGESAGSACVHYLVLSPLAKGLFHKAIAQSGTALAYWALQKDAREKAFKLGEIFNCSEDSTYSSAELLKCLRNIDSTNLLKAMKEFKEWNDDPLFPFVPTVEVKSVGDESFLSKDPFTLLKTGDYNHVPFITGVTSDEGAIRAGEFLRNKDMLKEIDSNFTFIAPLLLGFQGDERSGELADRIKKFYFGEENISEDTVNQLTAMFSDGMFYHSTFQTVSIMASTSKSPVYFYVFDYRGQYSLSKFFTGTDKDLGVSHADDLLYLFDIKVIPRTIPLSTNDKKMTDIFLDTWTNFATMGNPTPSLSDLLPNLWTTAKPDDLKLMRLNLSPSMENKFFEDRVQFWDFLFPRMTK